MVRSALPDFEAVRIADIVTHAPDHLTAQQQALGLVSSAIPFDVGTLATIDPATLLWTSCVIDGIALDPEREAYMFDNEYRQNDLLKIADLAVSAEPAAALSQLSQSVLEQSPRFQLLRRMGAVDELRCALVHAGSCWGSFEIYRSDARGPFTERDVDRAISLSDPLARLLRLALLRQSGNLAERLEDAPGVLIVDRNGQIVSRSVTADHWLAEIGGESSEPAVIRSLVMKLTGGTDFTLSTVVPGTTGGWLRFHATRMGCDDDAQVSVVIEPVKPTSLPDTIGRAYGLTPREGEVITWMTRGLSSKEIAVRMGISPHTVNDHIKSVFQKTGAQSRQQLIAALFFDHCLPLRERGAVPGPWGWFIGA